MSDWYWAIPIIILLLIFPGGRKFFLALGAALWKYGSIFLRTVFSTVMVAHWTLIKNLAPRSLVIKELEAEETSKDIGK